MNCVLVVMTVLFVQIVSVSLNYENATKNMEDFSSELKRVKRAREMKSSFTDQEKIGILKRHNELRRIPKASNMEIMYWDETLETVAQNWANKCIFKHNYERKTIQKVYPTVGENIFYTTGSVSGHPEAFINDWYNEVKDYTYDTLKCAQRFCTHYTQIVWHNTAVIGCGIKFCKTARVFSKPKNNVMIVVCDYAPAGNYRGQKPFAKGTSCSACPAKKPTCLDGLCGVANCGGMTCTNGEELMSEICLCYCKKPGSCKATTKSVTTSVTTIPPKKVENTKTKTSSDSVASCGGKTCKNGGKLMTKYCFCDCSNTGYQGDTCDMEYTIYEAPPSNTVANDTNQNGNVTNQNGTFITDGTPRLFFDIRCMYCVLFFIICQSTLFFV